VAGARTWAATEPQERDACLVCRSGSLCHSQTGAALGTGAADRHQRWGCGARLLWRIGDHGGGGAQDEAPLGHSREGAVHSGYLQPGLGWRRSCGARMPAGSAKLSAGRRLAGFASWKSAPRCMTYRMAGRCLPVGDKWCLRRGRRRPTQVPCRARGAVLRPQGSYPVGRHRWGGRRRGRPGSRLRKAPRDLLNRGVLRWPGWTSIKASSTRSRRGWISGHLTRLPWAGSSSTFTPRSSMRWSATGHRRRQDVPGLGSGRLPSRTGDPQRPDRHSGARRSRTSPSAASPRPHPV